MTSSFVVRRSCVTTLDRQAPVSSVVSDGGAAFSARGQLRKRWRAVAAER